MMRRVDDTLRRPIAASRNWRVDAPAGADERSTDDVLAAARAASEEPGAFVVGGGDPLGRGDLHDLLAALAGLRPDMLGLWTSGPRLDSAAVQRLRGAGVQRVHIPFHCARQDAHDWLVGQSGALKVAHRAIRACVDGDLPVVAEIVL